MLIRRQILRAWAYCRANPRSSIAGVAAILSSFLPKYALQLTGIASGLGLLMTSDAENTNIQPPKGN